MSLAPRKRNPLRWILGGVAVWIAGITLAHIAANIGFAAFAQDVRTALGLTRRSLRVGFLPVT